MKEIKKLISIVLSVFMALAVMGCGAGDPLDKQALKISMYMYEPEDWAVAYVKKAVDGFNAANKGEIKVNLNMYFGSQYNTQLAAAIESGTCPDIFTISNSNLSAYVSDGVTEPLNGYFGQEIWDDIIPESARQVKFGDTFYGFPWYVEPTSVLYYRKDIVETRMGLSKDDLKTFDGIYNVCQKMIEKNIVPKGSFPMYIPVGIPRGWATVGLQYNSMDGLYPISDDWKSSNLASGGMKDLMSFYHKIGTSGWCPLQDMTTRGYEDAAEGLCNDWWYMNFGGAWDIPLILRDYPEMKDKIGVVPLPTSTAARSGDTFATSTLGGWNYCISSSSSAKKKEAASKLIKYLLTDDDELAAKYFRESYYGRVAPRKSLQTYMEADTKTIPAEWSDTLDTVVRLGIPEPRYSWDIINLVNDMLSMSMSASDKNFSNVYTPTMSFANGEMTKILARGDTNPSPQTI